MSSHSYSEEDVERRRIEDMFDATFGSLLRISLQLGYVVEFGSDGLWHAKREPSLSPSAGVTNAKVSRPTPTR